MMVPVFTFTINLLLSLEKLGRFLRYGDGDGKNFVVSYTVKLVLSIGETSFYKISLPCHFPFSAFVDMAAGSPFVGL